MIELRYKLLSTANSRLGESARMLIKDQERGGVEK